VFFTKILPATTSRQVGERYGETLNTSKTGKYMNKDKFNYEEYDEHWHDRQTWARERETVEIVAGCVVGLIVLGVLAIIIN